MASLVDLSKWLDDLLRKIEPQEPDLQLAADNQVKRIKDRTAQGISFDLQPFTSYAPKTKKAPPVNLRQTGAMLDSMSVEADDSQARIFFDDPSQAQKAALHNQGTKYLPQRPFFGAGLQDHEEIVGDIRAALFRRVNQ